MSNRERTLQIEPLIVDLEVSYDELRQIAVDRGLEITDEKEGIKSMQIRVESGRLFPVWVMELEDGRELVRTFRWTKNLLIDPFEN